MIVLLIVGHRVRTTGVIWGAQLDKDFQRRAVARGFGLGDVDGLGIEIYRVDFAAGIDRPDL